MVGASPVFAQEGPAASAGRPWPHDATETVAERFAPPSGTKRVPLPEGHFGTWLRSLPVRPGQRTVHLFDGRPKRRQDVHLAVLDLDVGGRDLQQCADFAIRLHAEWLRARGRAPCYRFTSGHPARWADWQVGLRPVVDGRRVRFEPRAPPSASYPTFRRYLDTVFTYAGSRSLERDTVSVDPAEVLPGDLFVQGGAPGHVVVVLDVALDPARPDRRRLLLAQSYMPAQDPHVLAAPDGSAWFETPAPGASFGTPEWRFPPRSLRRFPADPCR